MLFKTALLLLTPLALFAQAGVTFTYQISGGQGVGNSGGRRRHSSLSRHCRRIGSARNCLLHQFVVNTILAFRRL